MTTPLPCCSAQRIDAFCRILQHIGERLRHQPTIEVGENRFVRQLLLKSDVRAADPHQKDRLAHAIGEVVPRRARLWRAREGREFVDHAFDVVHLPDNGVRALVEYVPALDDVPAVASFQPLGRELDRRQRISDLVRDAAGDVGPGGGALSGHEVADVVERDDARAIIASRISGDANVENALAAVPEHGRLPLMKPAAGANAPVPRSTRCWAGPR